jgi:hypothetical protein
MVTTRKEAAKQQEKKKAQSWSIGLSILVVILGVAVYYFTLPFNADKGTM